MAEETEEKAVCEVCREAKLFKELVPISIIRDAIYKEILKGYPECKQEGYICQPDLNRFREQYVRTILETEKGELSVLEKEVLESLRREELITSDLSIEYERDLSLGQRLADTIARVGGSWNFIIGFALFLLIWIVINTVLLMSRPFDPYPFILLNLLLSCLAAIQAPVIMMSQNRQEAKDRLRSQHDYQINLKAELEIRHLHEKVDHLIMHQWERLVEIQQIQIELMNELTKNTRRD